MQDPELLHATASEPLTMQEELEMQWSWRNDPNKCTFIVLARGTCSFLPEAPESSEAGAGDDEAPSARYHSQDDGFVDRNLDAMVGDVNLFISSEGTSDPDEEQDGNANQGDGGHRPCGALQAEIDVMIADKKYRNQGLGREACTLMLLYGVQRLGIRRFFCKVKESNDASLRLFRSMGFSQCGYAACFQEIELELRMETRHPLLDATGTIAGVAIETKLRTITCQPLAAEVENETKDVAR
jgi:ribosomal protein S18 acetylase RimI-like enzyme